MSIYESLNFQPMLITDVFETMVAARDWFDLSKADLSGTPKYPYVARSGGDNGIGTFLPKQQQEPPNTGNCITIGVSTSTVFYQPAAFYTSKEIQVLRHRKLNVANGLLLVSVLRQQMRKFQWGNGASLVRLKATKIMVPVTVTPDGETVVDWDGMTAFGEELLAQVHTHTHRARPSDASHDGEPPKLNFEPMLITDVFETMSASKAWRDRVRLSGGTGRYPYLSQTWATNGVTEFVTHQGMESEAGNCITVTLKTQATFYQPVPFYTAQNFLIFRHSKLSRHNALILVTTMRNAFKKFSWGYGVSMHRLEATRIMVPVTHAPDGSRAVDWDGMDRYGRWLATRIDERVREAF